ncbi:MAG TPA: MBG domain-containing protein [Thermoleophilaceae bacterium]|nr:MBG domain-containing protein [Thermoleophilaceae bacterium]
MRPLPLAHARSRALLRAFLLCALMLALAAPAAHAAPLPGSAYDSGDGNQENGVGLDWQGAFAGARVGESVDSNATDSCYVGGTKENAPKAWAFNTSAGGCTPGKSNVRAAWANPESTAGTTFAHFAFWRNDTTGNSFLTFELNQSAETWVNSTGTTIPCRRNGDLLLSFESAGGSALATAVYKWIGDGTGPAACPDGASGSFTGSAAISGTNFQGSMNTSGFNYLNPGAYGSSFPVNSFGEAAINLPAVLQSMGENQCFGFLQMQVHTRSSSSISSALIDTTTPIPVYIQSCSATGHAYQDDNGNGTRDAGEPGLPGFDFYLDLDDDGQKDAGEPSGTSDSDGFYRLLDVPAGTYKIREVAKAGWNCTGPSPCYYSRSFTAGGNSTGNDFGNAGPSSASGTKFHDLNANGVKDAGEPGLSGATIYADYDGDAAKDAGEPSATSDATGAWSITGVGSGTYKIREVGQAGWTCSLPAPCEYTRTFTSGSSAGGMVFGNWGNATIAGTVFEDTDGDGAAKEAGDVDLSGWQVYLDANGNDAFDFGETATTTTASGAYTLSGLSPGTRTVRVTLPSSSWYCTRPAQTAAACERELTVTSAQNATGHDFGFSRYATVSGSKFDDTSNNGIKDGSETGLAGFVFYVDYDNDDVLDADEPSATSAVTTGAWSITGVRAGSYPVREVPQGGWTCTKPATTCRYDLTVASGSTHTAKEFGNFIVRSVSGTLFRDNDADGLAREAGEPGVGGWTVYSDENNNSARDTGEASDVTNAEGFYVLTGLPNGAYRVRVVNQAGWTCAFPAGCVNTGSLGNSANANDSGKNFGVWGPASVSGTVSEDADADGAAREAGEAGLSGRTVYVDSNGNSVRDTGEPQATTDANGAYTITGINPGTYTIRQVLPGGWTCSLPSPCSYSVTTTGADLTGRDFASWTTGTVSGTLYEDRNADGDRDAGESALTGRTAYLDLNGNSTKDAGEPETTTDGSGNYAFARAPGSYSVRVAPAAGWTCSDPSPCVGSATLTSGSTATGRDFGLYTTGAIAGTVYEDSNFNKSVPDAGEPGLSGELLYLDADDDGTRDAGEPQATTNGSGAYSFTGLVPGTYVVHLAAKAGWACPFPTGCRREVTVVSQGTETGRDFGTYLGATVSGDVFEDADADGATREPSEDGVEGARVYLDGDLDGERDSGEPTTLTDADGFYELTGIEVQSWHVRVEPAAGWTCDSPAPCRHDVTLSSGDVESGQDFGVHGPATVSGHLFTDRDNDQQPQEFGENDQPGRTVYVDSNGNSVRDTGEPQTTTDGDGNYSLGDLEPGTHRIRQVLPAGWTCSTPNPCDWLVSVASSDAVTGKDFSSFTDATIKGFYYEDLNADARIPDPGLADPPLTGRTVYIDSDGDDTRDAGETQTTTDASGAYSFEDLAPGTYSIRVGAQPAGWTCNYPAGCEQTVNIEAGETSQQNDFAAYTTGQITGTKFNDSDADGVRDAGEPGLSGQVVYADLDDDSVKDAAEPSVTTNGSGGYTLTVAPGTYKVRTVTASGWTCTLPSPCSYSVTVASSGSYANRDFGVEQPGGTIEIEKRTDPAGAAGTFSFSATDLPGTADDSFSLEEGGVKTVEVPVGTYEVTQSELAGFTLSEIDCTDDSAVSLAAGSATIGVSSGETVRCVFTDQLPRIEVTADDKSKVYGADDPELTWSVTNGTLAPGDDLTGVTCEVDGEHTDAGAYAITCAGNTNESYVVTYEPGTLTVNPRPITVTAADKTKAYGNDDPALTHDITSGSLVDGDTLTGTLDRDSGEDVGAYDITQGTLGASDNYDLTFAAGELTVTKRPLTVTADDKTKAYGNDDPALTHGITSGSLVDGDTLTGAVDRDSGEDVGAYAITRGTLDAGGNYDLTFINGDLTITKRAITVTADDKTKVYGSNDPALTRAIITGSLVDGDTLTGAITRATGENVGAYTITRGTLTAGSNYDLTFIPGELTITKRPLTVTAADKTKVYGSNDPALTRAITAGSLVDGDSLTGAVTRATGEDVGAYAITRGTLTAGSNYALAFIPGELSITKRPLTVTPDDKTKVEGDPDPEFTWSVTDGSLAAGDALEPIVCGVDGSHDAPGTYDITCTSGANENYSVTFEIGSLEVTDEPEPEPTPPKIGDPVVSRPPTGEGDDPRITRQRDPDTGRDVYLLDKTGPCLPLQLDVPIEAEPGDITRAVVTFTPVDGGEPQEIELTDTPPEPADGTWSGTLECAADGRLTLEVDTPAGTTKLDIGEIVLIDPSGTVYDEELFQAVSGDGATPEQARCAAALAGATVTIQRRVDGKFVDIAPGDPGARPSINPQLTAQDGTYRWDVSEGRYRVLVSKDGYFDATSRVVSVPPPVLDLHVAMERRPGTPAPTARNCGEPPEVDTTGGCVNRPALAWVRGNQIRRVVFYLDGRRIKTVRRGDSKGRFGVRVDRSKLSPGKHRVRARVIFRRGAHRRPATVRLTLRRCLDNPPPTTIQTNRAPGCAAKPFLAFVRGDRVRVVAYSLDGRRMRSVKVADWNGRYGVTIDPSDLAPGRHTLKARVAFVGKSGWKPRTVKLSFTRCKSL